MNYTLFLILGGTARKRELETNNILRYRHSLSNVVRQLSTFAHKSTQRQEVESHSPRSANQRPPHMTKFNPRRQLTLTGANVFKKTQLMELERID